MLREEIIEYLGGDWELLNKYISNSLLSDVSLLNKVNEDILSHGGKMLRPIVALLIARLLNPKGACDEAIKVAAATELLHNATLLHDDVADHSATRRGEPTLCSKIGAGAAVLVGDFWLARAMELTITSAKRDSMAKIFSKAMTNLAEGEMLQLQKSFGEGTDEKDYFKIIYCKTASLFETACVSAAIASDASELQQKAISEYAISLGIAFQIKDDILDYVGDDSLGKPIGVDLREQKITLPLLCALKNAPERESEIRKMISEIHLHPQYCEQIRKFVIDASGVMDSEKILVEYIFRALEALSSFPESREKAYLRRVAEYNRLRKV